MRIAAFWPRKLLRPRPEMISPELVFLHIPKAAGTSARSALRKHYGADKVFWIGVDCPAQTWRYPREQIGGRFAVGGHKKLSFYPRKLDPLYCAILRDPVERAISLFAFYTRPDLALSESDRKSRTRMLEKLLTRGIEPDSMLRSIRNCGPFRRQISNIQCSYLSRGRATFADVRKSLKKLDHVIGTMNSYDRFHRELWSLLGWGEEKPVKFNRSRDNYSAPYLQDEELVALIGELNREDKQLVDWVESEHSGLWLKLRDAPGRQRRLRSLPLDPRGGKARDWNWEDASGLWPPREPGKLKWPLSRMMVAQPYRLIYMPTPGAADAAVRRMMLDLASAPHREALVALGISRVIERFATGLVLGDLSQAEIKSLAASRDYFRFAVLYEPISRLVDVFQQRFVEMRLELPRWPELYQLVADAQQLADPDCAQGISFRQFVKACVSGRYQHRLLLTQTRYLPWPDTYDRFYRPDQLCLLQGDLARLRGISVHLPEVTVNPTVAIPAAGAHYADTPAAELPQDAARWRDSLVDTELLEVINSFYAMDFKLYNRTADNDQEVAAQ